MLTQLACSAMVALEQADPDVATFAQLLHHDLEVRCVRVLVVAPAPRAMCAQAISLKYVNKFEVS